MNTRADSTADMSWEPWALPHSGRSDARLDLVPPDVIHLLAGEDDARLPNEYRTPYLRGADSRPIWVIRSTQIRENPDAAPWITRILVSPQTGRPVGMAGFHGPPDERGMVEIGYQVDPGHRRRGHARRAVEILLDVARRRPDVQVVRATISPDNEASLALISQYGFVRRGEQWDEEDGLEIIFEVSASASQA